MKNGLGFFHRVAITSFNKFFGTLVRVKTSEPVLALTFDDGPHPDATPKLLDILAKHDAKATFFMIGEEAKKYPELVKQVAQAGHTIGNHSWNHPSFPLISSKKRRSQIKECQQALGMHGSSLFRPPFGHQSFSSRLDAFLLGYEVVTFDVVAEDWRQHAASWMVEKLVREVKPGSIILFHDALYYVFEDDCADRNAALQAVDLLLQALAAKYRFVTVPDLMSRGKPIRKSWYRRVDHKWLEQLKKPKAEFTAEFTKSAPATK